MEVNNPSNSYRCGWLTHPMSVHRHVYEQTVTALMDNSDNTVLQKVVLNITIDQNGDWLSWVPSQQLEPDGGFTNRLLDESFRFKSTINLHSHWIVCLFCLCCIVMICAPWTQNHLSCICQEAKKKKKSDMNRSKPGNRLIFLLLFRWLIL